MSARHLVKRFFGSVSANPISEDEVNWVRGNLLATEFELWKRFDTPDQRHTYEVAKKTVELLGEQATRPVVAAALLHDIGKVDVPVSTFERVAATLVATTANDKQIESWSQEKGWLGRAGRYLRHNETGARMLEEAGSDPLTVTWAYEHELVHTQWSLPVHITDALWKADNA